MQISMCHAGEKEDGMPRVRLVGTYSKCVSSRDVGGRCYRAPLDVELERNSMLLPPGTYVGAVHGFGACNWRDSATA